MDPADYVRGKQKMIPLRQPTAEEIDNAVHRTFSFGRSSGTDGAPWTIKTDGGAGFNMDPRRLSANSKLARFPRWSFSSGGAWHQEHPKPRSSDKQRICQNVRVSLTYSHTL